MTRLKDMTVDELTAALKVVSVSHKIKRSNILLRQLQRKRGIPLLASHDIYLTPDLYETETFNNERFAALFRATWKRIPKPARDMILDYWKTLRKGPPRPGNLLPYISLCLRLQDWSGFPSIKEAVFASVHTPTQSILFYGPIIDRTPDQHVIAVIAHELAHVYLGLEFPHKYWQVTKGREPKVEERVADAFASKWGFDMRSFYKWLWSAEGDDLCMGVMRQYKLKRVPGDFAGGVD